MKEFIAELVKIEINEKNRTFNGYSSSDNYTQYLNQLYLSANFEKLSESIKQQLKDFTATLDAYLPVNQEIVDNMRHDALFNPDLGNEVAWLENLFEIRSTKEYYYQELLSLLGEKINPVSLKSEVEPVALEKELTNKNEVNDNLAVGYEAIGMVLGCQRTKLAQILKSGILESEGVVYYLGSRPVLDKGKWKSLLDLKPSILKSLKIK